ncbi:hypothetical protein TI39_contig5861g00001 [Zymoseptoria brevis]|uniref:Uncharacterized protein n=1 Tax=Zymoseptoria brevis TaxID=1047168 RepID=A0A0F4G4V5_9PEZI|nr:hypothetical protein TI39_contig5861g00001 [Zymoseptoria brevis]
MAAGPRLVPTSVRTSSNLTSRRLTSTRNNDVPLSTEHTAQGTASRLCEFSTGSVDAKDSGVNAGRPLSLNRTSTCVPLDINAGFAKNLGGGSEIGKWGYELGSVGGEQYSLSEYTFHDHGDPFSYDVRSYTMSTYVHT